MTHAPLSFRLLVPLLLAGCSSQSGTETDNPLQDERTEPPPPYQSPNRFNPNDPAAPGCPGTIDDTPPQRGPYWTASGSNLMGVDRRAGLMVIDAGDPLALSVASSTELDGYPWAAVGHRSGLAVVFDESPELPTDAIPQPEELKQQLTLAFFEPNSANALERQASVTLEGEFFALTERDNTLWALTTIARERAPSCHLPWASCSYPSRVELVIAGYGLGEEGIEARRSTRLPMSQRAWVGRDGFISFTSEIVDGDEQPRTLEWARINGSDLVEGQLAIDAAPALGTPVELVEDRLYYFTQHDDSLTLNVVDVGAAAAELVTTLSDLPWPGTHGSFFGRDWAVIGDETFTRAGVVVRFDGDAPTVTPIPSGLSMAMPLTGAAPPERDEPVEQEKTALPRLLAWGDIDGSGALSLALIDGASGLAEGQALSTLKTSLRTAVPLQENDPLYPPHTAQNERAVVFPYLSYDTPGERTPTLGVIDLTGSTLEFSSHEVEAMDDAVIAQGGAFFAPSSVGVASVDETQATSWLDFDSRNVADIVPVEGGTVTLQWTFQGSTQLVTHDQQGAELGVLELPGGARRLLPLGDQVGVLIEPEGRECEQRGGNDCEERSLWIVDPGNSPERLGRVELPETDSDSTSEDQRVQLLELGSGAWALALESTQTCHFIDECEAKGIDYRPLSEANVNTTGQVADCPPDAEDCPEQTEPPPAPEVYGTNTRLSLHRLDASEPSAPRLVDLGTSELELADSRFAPVQVSGDRLLVTRMEVQLERGEVFYNVPARFMVEVFDAVSGDRTPSDPSGASAVNIPGFALALQSADSEGDNPSLIDSVMLSVEPATGGDAAATLHRLRLEADGAHIEASRPLAGRYGDVLVTGAHAYYVRKGIDGCASGELQTISLDQDLDLMDSFTLPGTEWEVMDWSEDALLLRGPNYAGYALFDLDDDSPVLDGFFAPRVTGDFARVMEGEVWAPLSSYGVLHLTP